MGKGWFVWRKVGGGGQVLRVGRVGGISDGRGQRGKLREGDRRESGVRDREGK